MNALLQTSQLVGRDTECKLMLGALRRASEGSGSLVLVSGKAGIGKSRLVNELKRYAGERNFLIVSGGCYDLTTTGPYGPWFEAMQQIPPDDAAFSPVWITDGSENRKGVQQAIFDAMLATLRDHSRNGPLAVVLEDLHWVDQASLDALRYLARSIRDLPIVVAVTYRDDELTSTHALFEALPAVIRETEPLRIELGPLSIHDVRSLVAPLRLTIRDGEDLATYLYRRAQGNPLFTHELLRSLVAERVLNEGNAGFELGNLDSVQVPAFIVQLIERRLSRMNPDARGLLEIAAVIGQDVDVDFWSEVTGCSNRHLEDAVNQALALHVLEEVAGQLSFTHALIRETIYNSIALPRRREYHRLIAEALVNWSSADPDAVAHHFVKAGDRRALEWILRAGLRAYSAAAEVIVAQRFAQAAELLVGDDRYLNARGWLLYRVGQFMRLTDTLHGIALEDEALRIAEIVDDPVLAGWALWWRGQLLCLRGEIRQGLRDIEAGVKRLHKLSRNTDGPCPDEQIRAAIQSLVPDADLPLHYVTSSRVETVRILLDWWLAISGRYQELFALSAEPEHMALFFAYAGLGRPDEASREMDIIRPASRRERNYYALDFQLSLVIVHVIIPYRTDQIGERNWFVAEAAAAGERAAELIMTPHASGGVLMVSLLEGRWVEAKELAHQNLAEPWLFGPMCGAYALGVLGREQGQPEVAWEQIRFIHPDGPATEPGGSVFLFATAMQRLAVNLALDAGDLDGARDWLQAHDRWLEWNGAVHGRAEGLLLWARYHLASVDHERARDLAKQALASSTDLRQPLVLIAVHRFLGELNTWERDYDSATAHLAAAAELSEACQAPYEIALVQLALAELANAKRDTSRATHLLDQARSMFERLEARPALDRASQLEAVIEAFGRAYPAGLTPREVEVLQLIAIGRSNRQMAENLYLSVRTVERHVANIYRKIDAHNRPEATRYAIRHGLVDTSTT